MEFKKQVGIRIKEARKSKGLTMQELADKMRKDRVTITRYESGKLNLSIDLIEEICAALEVTPELILHPKKPS